jgi:hypothetical protein
MRQLGMLLALWEAVFAHVHDNDIVSSIAKASRQGAQAEHIMTG